MKKQIPWFTPMRIVFAALALLLVASCADNPDEDAYVEKPVGDLYNEAMYQLQKDEYKAAAKAFDEVERQHPYSIWATKAQLMSAYAYYQDSKYDEAVVAINRFLQLHPGHRDAVYAYYLRGLCYYEQITDVERDQKVTQQAADSLREVINRFPKSPYARDARLKLDLTLDHMAGKEMEIGRFYQKRGEYLAAINRFKIVITQYQTTTHVPEALHRLVESYLALGLMDEAYKAAAVLGYNFPGSQWYEDSYKDIKGSHSAAGGTGSPVAADDEGTPGQRGSWFGWLW
ncbi:MAG: outer membrane protein assembly factor BamD [Alphaproteobacteria bacterium]|nr:outer membrane protein assembly factor BamD [Alphaproteobacteria bacterium]